MASHYKVLVNDSGPIEFCFMPSLNVSTFGYINQTLKYPQAGSPFTFSESVYGVIWLLFGLVVNGLIQLVLIKNKKLRSESTSPAIMSLISANSITLIGGIGWFLIPYPQIGCKVFGLMGYALMLCSVFNLQGIGILKFCNLYFWKDVDEEKFRRVCKLAAIFAWIVTFMVSFPTAIGQWGQVEIECNTIACYLTNVNKDGSNTGYSMIRVYYASYFIIGMSNIILNVAIYYKIQSYFKAITSDIGNFSPDMEMEYMRKERQITKMMGANSVLYVFFPIPLAALHFIDAYPKITVEHWLFTTIILLWGSTAIVEPALILAFKEKYRQEIKKILKGAYFSIKDKFTKTHSTVNTSAID